MYPAFPFRFTPTQLVESLRLKGYNLGQVIDLTFTDRYYSSQEFRHLGVTHLKIKVPGKEIPGDDIFAQFSTAVIQFLGDKTKDGQLLAVHCAHGINRTGYLICRYLVEKCSMDVDSAIRAFNQARGHEIENQEYIANLKKIYGGEHTSSNPRMVPVSQRDIEPSHHKRQHHSGRHGHDQHSYHPYP